MRLTPADFLRAAKCPPTLRSCEGPDLFFIKRVEFGKGGRRSVAEALAIHQIGGTTHTRLGQWTESTFMRGGHVVMEDSVMELRRHLPIWLAARGRVLITGLGLGCVLRGLLAKPEVEHVDVIKLNPWIIAKVGQEFRGNPRVTIFHADALAVDPSLFRADYAWHDICTPDDEGLQVLHARLISRFLPYCTHQGAWAFPREVARTLPMRLLGAPCVRTRDR